ncbi:MAG: UDP-2,4-diacetamido-2,4,6-trideoxy-beta-L-altropyranose hydrolase [Pseudomonadota bacterium]
MNIAFRADASDDIGIGHIMRCLTLAKALQKHGATITFICRSLPALLSKKIESSGAQLLLIACQHSDSLEGEIEQLQGLFTAAQYRWFIIDHYHSDIHYERHFKPLVPYIMVIDDLADRSHDCDILLDQTPDRAANDYRTLIPDHCQALLGQRYALIRDEFIEDDDYSEHSYRIDSVLITLGGSDPSGVLPRLINTVRFSEKLESYGFSIIVPNTLYQKLRDEGVEDSRKLSLLNITATLADTMLADKMLANKMLADRMRQHDLIVTNCGVTLLERCALGKPGIGIVVADNQVNNARAIEHNGAGLIIYPQHQLEESLAMHIHHLSKHSAACLQMMNKAKNVIDGQGKYRVCKRLLSYQT